MSVASCSSVDGVELKPLGNPNPPTLAEKIPVLTKKEIQAAKIRRFCGSKLSNLFFNEKPQCTIKVMQKLEAAAAKEEQWIYRCKLARKYLMESWAHAAIDKLLECIEENQTIFLLKAESYEQLGYLYAAYNQYQKALKRIDEKDPILTEVQQRVESLKGKLLEDYRTKNFSTCFELEILMQIDSFASGLQKEAEKGDHRAKTDLAYCYIEGIGFEKDVQRGIQLCEEGRKDGYGCAIEILGNCYLEGTGVEQDEKKAFALYQEAVKRGCKEAHGGVGFCYEEGLGVAEDKKKAVFSYKQAAKNDVASAIAILGYCYEVGYGVKQDIEQARKHYVEAAKLGSGEALAYLAEWYEECCKKDDYGDLQILRNFRKALDFGYRPAKVDIARCYANGIGVDEDPKKAVALYEEAAEEEIVRAMYYFALHLGSGLGIAKNESAAVDWYRKASDLGYCKAKIALADCYRHGIGAERDIKEALRLYEEAGKLGSKQAYIILGTHYENRADPDDIEKAKEYYTKAVELGSKKAQIKLFLLKFS